MRCKGGKEQTTGGQKRRTESYGNTTLGAETFANFANFANFAQIRESLRRKNSILIDSRKFMHAKFFNFFLSFSKLVGCP